VSQAAVAAWQIVSYSMRVVRPKTGLPAPAVFDSAHDRVIEVLAGGRASSVLDVLLQQREERRALRQQVDRPVRVQVDQDGALDVPAPQGEAVDTPLRTTRAVSTAAERWLWRELCEVRAVRRRGAVRGSGSLVWIFARVITSVSFCRTCTLSSSTLESWRVRRSGRSWCGSWDELRPKVTGLRRRGSSSATARATQATGDSPGGALVRLADPGRVHLQGRRPAAASTKSAGDGAEIDAGREHPRSRCSAAAFARS